MRRKKFSKVIDRKRLDAAFGTAVGSTNASALDKFY